MKCSIPGCRYEAETVFNGNALCSAHLEAQYGAIIAEQQKKEEKVSKDSIGKKQPLRPKK